MATYYPRINVQTVTTPLGMCLSTHPSLYEVPVNNRVIIKIDMLQFITTFLNDTVGSSLTITDIDVNREVLVELLKGDGTDQQFQLALKVLCRNLVAMEDYVLWATYFEDNEKSFVTRVILPIRDLLNESITQVYQSLSHVRSLKFLMLHEEWLYLSIPKGVSLDLAYEYYTIE